MLVKSAYVPLLAASAPLASAQLDVYAKAAGLMYFGSATDTPGQRERAGLEAAYPQYDAILADNDEFSQTTPTNGQKWLFTEPQRGVFNFTEGDITANLAKEQGKLLRCHALVWHSQLAPWVETTEWTPEDLTEVITNHIENVAGHYKGQCYAWDVVNEALNEDGTWRESVFYNVLGEDYIKLAFRVASEVDPDAKLYYNDYNIESPNQKAAGVRRIIQMLQDDGIRIDGVGLQAHFVAGRSPSLDQQIEVINSYGAFGVETSYTELDVRIPLPLNETNLQWQKNAYRDAAGACAQTDSCIGVTTWDFYDPFSWVPYVFPGESNALLWFEDFTKHPAYYGVLAAFKNATGACDNKKRSVAQIFAA
ncbi:Endo-1,4-beta-xylanase D [Paramyrothecium foliicola]|nr:Endo-1,4-beta-xylanase D [Paramyrothecium foliicola]